MRVDVACDHAPWIHGSKRPAQVGAGQLMEVPPRNTVLHRHNAGVAMHQMAQIGGDGRYLVRLHAEDHKILHTGLCNHISDARRAHVQFVAALFNQRHPAGGYRSQIGTTQNQAHFMTTQRKLDTQHAANGAGSHDTNLHPVLHESIRISATQNRSPRRRGRPQTLS